MIIFLLNLCVAGVVLGLFWGILGRPAAEWVCDHTPDYDPLYAANWKARQDDMRMEYQKRAVWAEMDRRNAK